MESRKLGDPKISSINTRPLSSWSLDPNTAMEFAEEQNGLVVKSVIRTDQILATPVTGVGCWAESEIVTVSTYIDGEVIPQRQATERMSEDWDSDGFSDYETVTLPPLLKAAMSSIIEIDNNDSNADWIKSLRWDLPTDPDELERLFGYGWRERMESLPVWLAAPDSVKNGLSKHLGSEHDQKTHGSWSASGSPKLEIMGQNDGSNSHFNEKTRVVRYQPEGKEPTDYVLYATEDFVVSIVKPTDRTTINGYSEGGTNKGEIGHLDITGAGSNPWRDSAKDDNKATITEVAVRKAHQRRGLASAMLRFHRDMYPELDVQHSDALLPEGKAWAEVAKHQSGKHDQKTHGTWAAGSSDLPDGWMQQSEESRIQEFIARQRAEGSTDTDERLTKVYGYAFADTDEYAGLNSTRVIVSRDAKVSGDDLSTQLKTVADLQRIAPVQDLRVEIDDRAFRFAQLDDGVGGFVVQGGQTIYLRPSSVTDGLDLSKGNLMPVLNKKTYALVHEYGHVLDQRSVETSSSDKGNVLTQAQTGMSRYASGEEPSGAAGREAFAEAWTGWVGSQGRLADPVGSQQSFVGYYADKYGWDAGGEGVVPSAGFAKAQGRMILADTFTDEGPVVQFLPEDVMIKFATGLIPVLKHQSGKHDQKLHGRWSGSSSNLPEGWVSKSREDVKARLVDKWSVGYPYDIEYANELAEEFLDNTWDYSGPNNTTVISKTKFQGSKSEPPNPESLNTVLDALSKCQKQTPVDGLVVEFSDRPFREENVQKEAKGFVVRGTKKINMRPGLLDGPPSSFRSDDGHFMPEYKNTKNNLEYYITHEYGHVVDNRSQGFRGEVVEDRSVLDSSGSFNSLSKYGQASDVEAYAESYAEWSLSDGESGNEAATYFADKYGWGDGVSKSAGSFVEETLIVDTFELDVLPSVVRFSPGLVPTLKHLGSKHDQKTHGRGSSSDPLDYAFATTDFEAARSYGSSVYLVSKPDDAEYESFLGNAPGLDFMSRTGFTVIREVDSEVQGDALYHGSDRNFRPGDLVKPHNVRFQSNSSSLTKHQQGKHDQKSHGRWAGSADFSEWGDRAAELEAARSIGPDADDLRNAMSPDPDSVSDMAVRERLAEYHEFAIEEEVEDRMSSLEGEDMSEYEGLSNNSIRNKFYEEAVDEYVADYGDEARQAIAMENVTVAFDSDSMDEVFNITHEGFNRDGAPVNLSSRVLEVESFNGKVSVRGEIKEGDFDITVGEFHRVFSSDADGNVIVTHELLQIWEEEYQGAGFSKTFNRQAENYYITHGIDTIYVHAALDGGGYAWAKQGFGWRENTVSQDTANISKRIDDYVSFKDDALSFSDGDTFSSISMRFKLLEFGDDDFPTPMEVANVGRKDGDENWAGKEVMRGSEWFGKKILRPEGPRKSDTQIKNEQNREPRPEDGEQLKFNVGKSITLTFAPGLIPILKNAPGTHDQRSHGSWATGRGGGDGNTIFSGGSVKDYSEWGDRAAELREAENRGPSEETLRRVLTQEGDAITVDRDSKNLQSFNEVFNLQHVGTTRDGQDVAVESIFKRVEYDVYLDSVNVTGDIKTPAGDSIGSFERKFELDYNGDLQVEHAFLSVPENARGAGFGQKFIRQSENYYITHGVKRVNVGTGLDDGGFHWAKAGFEWDTSKSESEAVGDVDSALDNYYSDNSSIMSQISDIQSRMALTAWGDDDYPAPDEIADIGIEFKEDGMWAGKEMLSGTAWYGTKEMVPEG